MFATLAGAYSRKPLPAQPDVLADAERDLAAGRLDEAGLRAVTDGLVREVLHEMEVVGLGVIGDGGVRTPDRALPWIDGLGGLRAGDPATLPDGETVTRPIVEDEISRPGPVTLRDWQFAAGQSDLIVKQAILGPYTLAALAEPDSPGRRRRLAVAFGEALNAELHDLDAAGCPLIEIDEPLVMLVGDDPGEWSSVRAAQERLTAGFSETDESHLSLGLWGGDIDRAGYDALLEVPYKSYLVDVLAGPSAWRFIAAVPAVRGVIVGAADAGTEQPDETEVLVWAMAWAAAGDRGSARVGCAPNGSLRTISRHYAHRKCLGLGEAVKIASMGPLQDVARALDEDPIQSKMAELRQMAAALHEADVGLMPMSA